MYCRECSNSTGSWIFIDLLSSFHSLNILYVCGGGLVRSGCCDYHSVMNALLMCSEPRWPLLSANPADPHTSSLTDTMTFTSTLPLKDLRSELSESFSLYSIGLSSFTHGHHGGVNAWVHPCGSWLYSCLNLVTMATTRLHVLFINDRG